MSHIEEKKIVQLPKRVIFAMSKLIEMGFDPVFDECAMIMFKNSDGNVIKIYPYSGWFTGKGIKDGRGIKNLLIQL